MSPLYGNGTDHDSGHSLLMNGFLSIDGIIGNTPDLLNVIPRRGIVTTISFRVRAIGGLVVAGHRTPNGQEHYIRNSSSNR